MNNIIKTTSLSLFTILALQACSGGGNSASSNSVQSSEQNSFIQKDGLSGVVLADTYIQNATVCFDINKNGFCDDNEHKEKTYENGKFSFSKFMTDNAKDAPLLAQVGNSYILTASQDNVSSRAVNSSFVISPFTTLVYNEQLFNPYTDANKQKAITQLINSSNVFNQSFLEGEDYLKNNPNLQSSQINNLIASLKDSFKKDLKKPLETVANVVDEIVKKAKADPNNEPFKVNITTLKEQTRFDSIYSLRNINQDFDIPSQDGNQRSVGISQTSDKTIIHSKWNNKLTLINKSNSSIIESKNFLDGEKENSSSGPSEKVMKKIIVDETNSNVYSFVSKDKDNNTNIGLGVYKTSSDLQTVPSKKYNYAQNLQEEYYSHEDFTDMVLNNNKTKLALSSKDDKILIFNSSSLSTSTNTISTNHPVSKILYSLDDSKIFAAYNNALNIINTQNYQDIIAFNLSKTINNIISLKENELIVSFENSKDIYVLNVANPSNVQITKTLSASENVNKIILSKDKKSLIASFVQSKNIQSFLLEDSNVSTLSSVDTNINDISLVDDKTILVISDFKAYYLDLEGNGKKPNDQDKINWQNTHR